jgi:hypothetical protein
MKGNFTINAIIGLAFGFTLIAFLLTIFAPAIGWIRDHISEARKSRPLPSWAVELDERRLGLFHD